MHQINETHLGPDATPEQAVQMAEILTAAGHPSEHIASQGITPKIDIPDDVWFAALAKL